MGITEFQVMESTNKGKEQTPTVPKHHTLPNLPTLSLAPEALTL